MDFKISSKSANSNSTSFNSEFLINLIKLLVLKAIIIKHQTMPPPNFLEFLHSKALNLLGSLNVDNVRYKFCRLPINLLQFAKPMYPIYFSYKESIPYFAGFAIAAQQLVLAATPYFLLFVSQLIPRAFYAYIDFLRSFFDLNQQENGHLLAIRHFDSYKKRRVPLKKTSFSFVWFVFVWRMLLEIFNCGQICFDAVNGQCFKVNMYDNILFGVFWLAVFLLNETYKPVFLVKVRDQSLFTDPALLPHLIKICSDNNAPVVRVCSEVFFEIETEDYAVFAHVLLWLPNFYASFYGLFPEGV